MKLFIILIAIILGGIYGFNYQSTLVSNQSSQAQAIARTNSLEAREAELVREATVSEADVVSEIVKVFGKEGKEVALQAINCSYGESKWNSLAVNVNKNWSVDRGIFQVNSVHKMNYRDAHNYKLNIAKAYEIWKIRGWKAWYSPRCRK